VDDEEARQLRDTFARRVPMLEALAADLENVAKTGLRVYEHEHVDRVYFRAKDPKSFVGKVRKREEDVAAGVLKDDVPVTPYTNPLTQIEDQVAGRALVFFLHDIKPVVAILEDAFHRVEMQDRAPQKDAEFGYESTHLVCAIPDELRPPGWLNEEWMPQTFELQVRTLFSHAWAEPQHDLGYKGAGDLTRKQRRHLAWIAASAWGADEGLERAWNEIGVGAEKDQRD
jgi:ppGpp synthetase/RelA/SpoT-type nucleotidyltranferase